MHRCAFVFDLVAKARKAFAVAVQHAVDDVGDVALPRAKLSGLPGGQLEVGDRLVSEPSPDGALGRRVLCLVDAPTDEVEERCGELVRARLAALAQKRRDESGLRVGRRLLLVLAVVPGPPLASHEPEHGGDEEDRRDRREPEDDHAGSERVGLQRVDPVAIVLVALGVGELLLDDPVERVSALDTHPGGRRERRPRNQRAQLDELVRRDLDSAEGGTRADQLDIAANPYGLAPCAQDRPGRGLDPDEARERLRPLVAPDLEVHVHDVVVRDGDSTKPVGDRERPRLVAGIEVPDDAHRVTAPLDAERSAGSGFQVGLVAPLKGHAALCDGRIHERLAFAERDVSVPEVEVAGERHLQSLAHTERPVLLDVHGDIRREQRERIGARRAREREDSNRGTSRER